MIVLDGVGVTDSVGEIDGVTVEVLLGVLVGVSVIGSRAPRDTTKEFEVARR